MTEARTLRVYAKLMAAIYGPSDEDGLGYPKRPKYLQKALEENLGGSIPYRSIINMLQVLKRNQYAATKGISAGWFLTTLGYDYMQGYFHSGAPFPLNTGYYTKPEITVRKGQGQPPKDFSKRFLRPEYTQILLLLRLRDHTSQEIKAYLRQFNPNISDTYVMNRIMTLKRAELITGRGYGGGYHITPEGLRLAEERNESAPSYIPRPESPEEPPWDED